MEHKWQEVTARIGGEAAEAAGEVMLRHGAHGVAFESDALILEAVANRWGDYFPPLTGDTRVVVKAYFHQPKTSPELDLIRGEIEGLASFGLQVGPVELTARIIAESDWAQAWKQHYHPIKIGRVLIEPSWEPAVERHPEDVVITLDPGMAFGTGAHPTTAMCLEALQEQMLDGRIVWDIGTGSGILAVAAAKLGAKEVLAVDIDPVAVAACRENSIRNGTTVMCLQGSLADLAGKADLIIANIIADVVIELMSAAAEKLNSGGTFLVSGIIESRAGDVAEHALKHGFEIINSWRQGEWVCMELKLRDRADKG